MSFFDDEDDAIEEEPRRASRPSGGARPRAGSPRARSGPPRRPPSTPDAAIERRRIGAVAVLVVVVILMVLLISSCQARNTRNSLENYNNDVSKLITQSDNTGKAVFAALKSGKGGSGIAGALAGPTQDAQQQLSDAEALSVPGQMAPAQANVVLALRMRYDGIYEISHAVSAITNGGSAARQAVSTIAGATARFYASDVIYKSYATREIASALHGDNIPGVGTNIVINGGQFLPDLGWLQTSYLDTELNVSGASSSGGSSAGQNSTAPGLHGDALVSAVVGSVSLSTTGTTIVPASPAPTFTLSVLNGGDFNQYGITCTVSVAGGSSAKSTISEIAQGATQTCNVKLPSAVATGTYLVTATISKVPGETNLTNNSATYSVEFQ